MCILFAATYPERTTASLVHLYGTFARGLHGTLSTPGHATPASSNERFLEQR